MDEWSILLGQVLALQQKFAHVTRLLDSPALDPHLRSRVRARFDRILLRQLNALKEVENKTLDRKELPSCWEDFRKAKSESEPIFHECLEFIEGALLRAARIDNGICRIADSILDDLSRRADIHWERFTILAPDEFFGNMAEIIRLRFPEANIWQLSVAVHEFGHFVAQELKTPGTFSYPFQEILKRERERGTQYANHLQEFFADIFATYAAGPALAYTCLSLRFDPGASRLASRTHPPDARRFYVMLGTLQRMDRTSADLLSSYGNTIEELDKFWRQSLNANAQLEKLDEAEEAELNVMLDELFKLMMLELPHVRYTGWRRALGLASILEPDGDELPNLAEDVTSLDIINAAWLWRAYNGQGAINRISAKAIKLCEQVMTQRIS